MGRLELRMSDELLERLDAARGDVPRGTFVKAALERALPAGDAAEVAEAVARRDERAVVDRDLAVRTEAMKVAAPARVPVPFVKPFRPMPKK